VKWQLCKALGVPFSAAKCADEISAYDEYVATAMTEAERIYREAQDKDKR
jgi:hypothetical protein